MNKFLFISFLFLIGSKAVGQQIYFPPILNQTIWETQSPESLGWCTEKVDSLYQFLEQNNSKAFILLKDGRIVLEQYFGTFSVDSAWYWASAGKTITSFLVGKSMEEQLLNLNQKSSEHLGIGWTSCPIDKENLITIRNQLTMTSGLDDGVPDVTCTQPQCLVYLADAGTRWAYHNAPYTMLDSVLQHATGSNLNALTQIKLKNQTGMTGLWARSGFDNVFYSRPRSMARFGILVQNKFKWNNSTLLADTALISQMTNTSQNLNLSYGYLWWLNGKASYKLPTSQITFPGPLSPQAPADLVAAMGKNGQILGISRERGLVLVRMGNPPNSPGGFIPNVFLDDMWRMVNKVLCTNTPINEVEQEANKIEIFPNPTDDFLVVSGLNAREKIRIINSLGSEIQAIESENSTQKIDMAKYQSGIYFIQTIDSNGRMSWSKFVKK